MLGHSGAGKTGTDKRNGVNGMKADFRKTMEALDSVSTEKLLSCAHSCPPPDRRKIVRVIEENLDVQDTSDEEEIFEFLPEENNED